MSFQNTRAAYLQPGGPQPMTAHLVLRKQLGVAAPAQEGAKVATR